MKFANVNGEKKEAEKGLSGVCQGCGQPMLSVCGTIRIKHWRHKVDCECDRWWENETEWHRTWKSFFPKDWQEVRHKDDVSGEWHIADVKTEQGSILEFQHSFLKSEERQARNNFYGEKLVWVVDGMTRQRDRSLFDMMLKDAKNVTPNSPVMKLSAFVDECPLLRDWSECNVPVFFDFGPDVPLWCLLPKTSKAQYVLPYSRQNFVALHNGSLNGNYFSDFITFLTASIFAYENPELIAAAKRSQVQAEQSPVIQRQIVLPRISLRELNYLMRPPRRQFRRYRK